MKIQVKVLLIGSVLMTAQLISSSLYIYSQNQKIAELSQKLASQPTQYRIIQIEPTGTIEYRVKALARENN